MNKYVQESINEAKKESGCALHGMSLLESKFFRQKVSDVYGQQFVPDTLFWTTLKKTFSVRDKNAWTWLDEFLQQRECYLFFELTHDETVYQFPQNQSIVNFFHELPVYVFYLTNEKLDYLITYNDHDYLAAYGTAEEWLRKKAISLSKTGWKDMDGKSW